MPVEQSLPALVFATAIMVVGFGRGLAWALRQGRRGFSITPDASAELVTPPDEEKIHWLDLGWYVVACVVTLMVFGPLLPVISILLGWYLLERRGIAVADLWGFKFKEWGWYLWRGADLYFLIIIPLSICAALSVLIFDLVGFEVSPQPLIQDFLAMEDTTQILQLIVLAVVVAPIWEEIVFRGILYPLCRGLRGAVFGMLSTAVLFGLVHGHGPSFFPLAFLGWILAYTFEKTGKLGLCIGLHAAFNASTTITLLLIKYGS